MSRATTYYARYLWEAQEAAPARDYLLRRGLSEETLREFKVGYAPSAWDRMLRASRSSGYSEEELLATGLAQRSRNRPGQIYDRFRERIMFPASDARGRVHGFGARAMRDNQRPKYLNTSDGELYHKREVLFGIDMARAAGAKADRMVLAEGYTDVLALHQAGVRNAVGIMGTSLTEEQVTELARIAHVLELCLDADRAGQEAMLRAARLVRARKLELRVVGLPEGADPADLLLRDGPEALVERVAGSQPFVVFNVERILERADLRSAEGRDRALDELGPVMAEVPAASVLRDDLMRRIAGRLEVTGGRLVTLLAAAADRAARGEVPPRAPTIEPGDDGPGPTPTLRLDPGPRSERLFLALCIALPDRGTTALESVDIDEVLTSGSLRRAAHHLQSRMGAPLSDLPPDDEEFARLIAGLVELAGRVPDPSADRLEHARLVLERDRLDRAIIRVRGQGAGTGELARQRETIREAIRAVGSDLESAF